MCDAAAPPLPRSDATQGTCRLQRPRKGLTPGLLGHAGTREERYQFLTVLLQHRQSRPCARLDVDASSMQVQPEARCGVRQAAFSTAKHRTSAAFCDVAALAETVYC